VAKSCKYCFYGNFNRLSYPCNQCVDYIKFVDYRIPENNPPPLPVESDPVKHPSHYCKGGLECINVIKAITSDHSGIMAVYVGNAQKYLWRFNRKNGLEDLEKLKQYVQWMIEEVQHGSARD
jgi:hypothetical protein